MFDLNLFAGVEGPSLPADDQVLLAADPDLTAGTPWAAAGFVVAPWLGAGPTGALRAGLAGLLRTALRRAGLDAPDDFDVAHYHRLIAGDQARHLAVIAHTKEYSLEELPVPAGLLEARVGALCGRPVQARNPHTREQVFHLRIVRPGRADHNPLHRDAWMPRYRGALNIYAPVAGSTAASSLSLVPGSHHWPESVVERTAAGALYHGAPYRVPGAKSSRVPLAAVRPHPGPDEVLVFSPYLLHGGAANHNEDATRISLEMRFWQA